MPFDSGDESPSLRVSILVEALRGKMPDNFKFNFRTLLEEEPCGSVGCALGLAALLWPKHKKMLTRCLDEPNQAKFFGISEEDVCKIFWDRGPRDGAFYRAEHPRATTVALALERAAEKNR